MSNLWIKLFFLWHAMKGQNVARKPWEYCRNVLRLPWKWSFEDVIRIFCEFLQNGKANIQSSTETSLRLPIPLSRDGYKTLLTTAAIRLCRCPQRRMIKGLYFALNLKLTQKLFARLALQTLSKKIFFFLNKIIRNCSYLTQAERGSSLMLFCKWNDEL